MIAPWLVDSLLDLQVKSAAVLALAAGGAWLVRRQSAARRHAVHAAAFAAVLCLPAASFLGARNSLSLGLPDDPQPARRVLAAPFGASASAEPIKLPAGTMLPGDNDWMGSSDLQIALYPSAVDDAAIFLRWAALLWIIGTTGAAVRFAMCHIAARRLVRRSVPVEDEVALRLLESVRQHYGIVRRVDLLISAETEVPMTRGILPPIVVVPLESEDWDSERWESVLRHELAHIVRNDFLWHQVTRLACLLLWLNPMASWLERELRRQSEKACDAMVLAGGVRPSAYAALLLAFARRSSTTPAAVASLALARGSELRDRVESIIDAANRRVASPAGAFLPASITAMLAILVVSSTVTFEVFSSSTPGAEGIARPRLAARLAGSRMAPADLGAMWYSTGQIAMETGRHAEAAQAFGKCVEYGFELRGASFNLAKAEALMGKTDAALDWLEEAASWGMMNAELWEKSSELDSLRGEPRYTAAIERVRRNSLASPTPTLGRTTAVRASLLVDPTTADAVLDGRAHARDCWREMLDTFSETASQTDAPPAMLFNLGYAAISAGQYERALGFYERTNAAGYEHEKSTFNIACCYAQLGRTQEAVEALRTIVNSAELGTLQMEADPDLQSLRGDPEFRRLIDERRARVLELEAEGKGTVVAEDSTPGSRINASIASPGRVLGEAIALLTRTSSQIAPGPSATTPEPSRS